MNKRRMQKGIGYFLIMVSMIVGIYLIFWTFGLKPLDCIIIIWKNRCGVNSYVKIVLKVMKIIFGSFYTLIMMAIGKRFGNYLIAKSKNW